MRPPEAVGAVIHVRSLEEALSAYAHERVAGRPNPTFTVDQAVFESFAPYANRSYTVHAQTPKGEQVVLRGCLLHFAPLQ